MQEGSTPTKVKLPTLKHKTLEFILAQFVKRCKFQVGKTGWLRKVAARFFCFREELVNVIEDVLDKLDNVRTTSGGYTAKCPAHEDKRPSLSIRQASDRVLLYCHSGCDIKDICDAIGIEVKDLFMKDVKPAKRRQVEVRQSTKSKFENLRHDAFLEMAEFRDLTRELYEDEKLEASGDVLWAKHKEPLIEHYMQVLANGTKEEIIELMKGGVVGKWASLWNSPQKKLSSSRDLMLQST